MIVTRPSGARGERGLLAVTVLVLAFLAPPAEAHPLAPSLLELRAVDELRFEASWKISVLSPDAGSLEPVLPASCRPAPPGGGGATAERDGAALIRRWTVDCPGGLEGERVTVDGLERTDARVLVRVVLPEGRTARAILDADAPEFVVPRRTAGWQVAWSYLGLGFEHILGGYDHLLFVLGLLFLVRGRRALVGTVTAFTLGHSVTLSLAALGLVRVPSAPVELAIALSIWVLAVELARDEEKRTRRPWRMAGFFGLLHGLGFAGALAEAGLPEGEIPLALLSFNTGLELGQLLFIAAVLLVVEVAGRLPLRATADPRHLERRLALPAAYLIGALSFQACLERAVEVWRTWG